MTARAPDYPRPDSSEPAFSDDTRGETLPCSSSRITQRKANLRRVSCLYSYAKKANAGGRKAKADFRARRSLPSFNVNSNVRRSALGQNRSLRHASY
jgi:hypothetical protein